MRRDLLNGLKGHGTALLSYFTSSPLSRRETVADIAADVAEGRGEIICSGRVSRQCVGCGVKMSPSLAIFSF